MAVSATPEPGLRLPGCRVDVLECGPGSVELHFDGQLTFRQIYRPGPGCAGSSEAITGACASISLR